MAKQEHEVFYLRLTGIFVTVGLTVGLLRIISLFIPYYFLGPYILPSIFVGILFAWLVSKIYISLRDIRFFKKINSLLLKNEYDEANDKLEKAITNQPRLVWIKGYRATVLNAAGQIAQFESFASEVIKLPGNKKRFIIGILSMQNINDYLSGRRYRNSEWTFSFYIMKKRPKGYAALTANILVYYYSGEHHDWVIKAAYSLLNFQCFFYRAIAASVLANTSYKNQDIEKAREYAKMALDYAPSDEMKELLKNLHKSVL